MHRGFPVKCGTWGGRVNVAVHSGNISVLLEHTLMQLVENVRCDEQREDRLGDLGDPQVLAILIPSESRFGLSITTQCKIGILAKIIGSYHNGDSDFLYNKRQGTARGGRLYKQLELGADNVIHSVLICKLIGGLY
jgi:hypothetical protein